MRRIFCFLVLFGLFGLFGVVTAQSASAAPSSYTITIQVDADVPSVWPRNAPSMWSRGTPLNIVYGPCSGPYCIQVHTDANGTACTTPEGYNPPGCAGDIYSTDFPDLRIQTCHVWLGNSIASQPATRYWDKRGVLRSVYGHEVGHCVLRSGWHNPDPLGIMHNPVDSQNPVTKPLRSELDLLSAAWA